MSELPMGWMESSLGELCVGMRNGISVKPASDAGLAVLRISAVRAMQLDASDIRFLPANFGGAELYKLREGDLLFTRYNGNRGLVGACARVGLLETDLVYPDKLIRVRIDPELASSAFVERAATCGTARSFIDKKLKTSAGQIGISGADLKQMPIPLAPLAEQVRITDKLDKLLARIDACRDRLYRLPTLIDRLRQSALTSAMQGRLTADWRAVNGGMVTESNDESDDPVVRSVSGWTYERADEACSKVQSGGTPREGFIAAGGAPFLKVYNLVGQQVDFAYRQQFIGDEIHRGSMRKSITLPGDVLMNIVGPPLGKVAVVPADFPQWNINQAITLFRAGSKVLSEWLYFVLCEGSAVRQVMPDTRGSVGQVNISLSQCRAFVLPVPPIDEQREAIRRLQKLFGFAQQLSDRLRNAEAAVNRLTPAVLAKAFRGELVAQDPADEPAHLMLQRLRSTKTPEAAARRRSPAPT